jgi:hypothetical protein
MSARRRPARRGVVVSLGGALALALAAGFVLLTPGPKQSDPPPAAVSGTVSTTTAAPAPTRTTLPTTTPAAGAAPQITRISDQQWARIVATGTWRPGCPVGQRDLRRLDVNYWDFSGQVARGAIVANADAIDDISTVMSGLFDRRFAIAKMRPVEEYSGDTAASLAANNTSAFNCRRPNQINAPVKKSPHANGRAIDINPVQNPWVDPRCQCWRPSAEFAKARSGPGVIRKGSAPYELFTELGWIWQNIDVPDYMHFDTGYPSTKRS